MMIYIFFKSWVFLLNKLSVRVSYDDMSDCDLAGPEREETAERVIAHRLENTPIR